jgi:hypothetical protein
MIDNLDLEKLEKTFEIVKSDPNLLYEEGHNHDHGAGMGDHNHDTASGPDHNHDNNDGAGDHNHDNAS